MSISLPPVSLPGLTSLPPLQLSSSATSGVGLNGAAFSASGAGDWNVNLGGSGSALQAGGSMPWWIPIALAGGAAWLLLHRRR